MKYSQILSTLTGRTRNRASEAQAGALLFDACRVGEVLRAVLLVQVVVTVGSLYWQETFELWLLHYSILTGATLPATLAWLISTCALKKMLTRLPKGGQYAAGVALGAMAGLYGCAMLEFAGLLISPPWLASALTGALLSAVLVAALVLRAKGTLPAATTARLTELQARIRPHFLFNTLNSAIALVRDEPARAEGLLEDLSDLFRHALADPSQSVTVADEIALAKRYLAIEQVRFGERMHVIWSVDPAANGAQLPHLLLQPLVENAVVHGVEASVEPATIFVTTERRGEKVIIQVVNTVPASLTGAGPGRGSGMALANVRDRLNLLHDVQGQFWAEREEDGFHVRIEIPA